MAFIPQLTPSARAALSTLTPEIKTAVLDTINAFVDDPQSLDQLKSDGYYDGDSDILYPFAISFKYEPDEESGTANIAVNVLEYISGNDDYDLLVEPEAVDVWSSNISFVVNKGFGNEGEKTHLANILRSLSDNTALSPKRNTLVINLFGGPGSGKTACAYEIAAALNKRGYCAEYVGEHAKQLIYDGQQRSLVGSAWEHQMRIYIEQDFCVERLLGKVDFIVTDSPALLSYVYINDPDQSVVQGLRDIWTNAYKERDNFALFIKRPADQTYQQAGRIHNLEQSQALDEAIKTMLRSNDIYFGTYTYDTIGLSVDNMIKTFAKLTEKEGIPLPPPTPPQGLFSDENNKPAAAEYVRSRLDDVRFSRYMANPGLESVIDGVGAFDRFNAYMRYHFQWSFRESDDAYDYYCDMVTAAVFEKDDPLADMDFYDELVEDDRARQTQGFGAHLEQCTQAAGAINSQNPEPPLSNVAQR